MVDRKEITHLGDLVKVDLKEPEKYITQVEQILNYVEGLDKVDFKSEATLRREVQYDDLREDRHEAFSSDGKPLVEFLKKAQGNFIRAPKMI